MKSQFHWYMPRMTYFFLNPVTAVKTLINPFHFNLNFPTIPDVFFIFYLPYISVQGNNKFCPVYLSAWVCGTYVVHHFKFNGTELCCAPSTCIVHKGNLIGRHVISLSVLFGWILSRLPALKRIHKILVFSFEFERMFFLSHR